MTEFQEGMQAAINMARKDAPPEVQQWLDSLPRGRSDYVRPDGTRLARTDQGRFYPAHVRTRDGYPVDYWGYPLLETPVRYWNSSSEERFG